MPKAKSSIKKEYAVIGGRIREFRKGINKSKVAFADILGIKNTKLGRIESGQSPPPVEVLDALRKEFNLSSDYILFGYNPPVLDLGELHELHAKAMKILFEEFKSGKRISESIRENEFRIYYKDC